MRSNSNVTWTGIGRRISECDNRVVNHHTRLSIAKFFAKKRYHKINDTIDTNNIRRRSINSTGAIKTECVPTLDCHAV